MKTLIKTKHFRTDVPLSRDPAKPVAVFLEFLSLSWVPHSRQGVCECILGGGDPFGLKAKLGLNFGCRHGPGHPKSAVVAGSTVGEEEECRHIIGMDGDLTPLPVRAPYADGDDVGEQLQVCNTEIAELGRGGGRNVLVIVMVIGTDTGFSVIESIRRGVEGYMEGVVRYEERHPVAERDCFLPPPDVGPEIFVQHNGLSVSGGAPFGGQAPVEEEAAGRDNIRRIQQLPAQDREVMLGSDLLGDPLGKKSGEGLDFVLGKPHCIVFGVVEDSQTLANRTGGGDVARGL